MIAIRRAILIALAICLLGPALARTAAQDSGTMAGPPFHPPGMWTWDNWFAHDGERWHAFYLQLPKAVGPERRWKDNDFYKHVGHATSTDLRTWQDLGAVVCALSGTLAAPGNHYIMKVLPVAASRDVAIFTMADKEDSGISPPYPLEYQADHSLLLRPAQK